MKTFKALLNDFTGTTFTSGLPVPEPGDVKSNGVCHRCVTTLCMLGFLIKSPVCL
jgi:hypothetical protein